MAFIDFTNGEVLTADQMDTVMRQSVMRFADAAARDTALSAVLAEGLMCYLDDTNEVLKYDGSSWIDISGDITGVTAGTALTGGGTSGNVTLDVDETALNITASQISDVTATATELNFVDGVTSAIQTQIDSKQDDVITTQGDLVIGDASGDPVRLPVGTADQILTSDGTTVSFQDPAGGGGMTLLASGSLTGASVTISSISQDYKTLVGRIYDFRCTTDETEIEIQFNGDSGSNYWYGTANSSGVLINQTEIEFGAEIATDENDGFGQFSLPDYSSSAHWKIYDEISISRNTNNTDGVNFRRRAGVYAQTTAISSILLQPRGGTFSNGTYEIYGVN